MVEIAVDDGVGGAIDEGKNRRRRVGGAILGKRRAAEDEEIGNLPVLKIGRDDRMGG